MQAWTLPISWVSALAVLLLVHLTHAAPLTDQTTEIEYYPVADSTGCYYNFQHYDEGDRIITNEPCLNCTCHNRMLMCYLRVCPFTKAIGQDCTVEKRPDQCCPVITCPEVPVQLLTSTTTESSKPTDVGHPDRYGCSIDNLFYTDGARVPSHPNKPCELCYCIRNKTACVMQECTLKIEGCKPVYQEGVCCPVKYDCEYPEGALLETTVRPTPALITTTTLAPGPADCVYNNEIYADGALVKKDIPCEHCYCMKGDIVCAVQECGPTPLDKVNCTALPRREGQCCPDTYDCENAVEEEITTEGYEYSTTPVVQPVVSEEEASSAVPAAAVTEPPALEEAATVSEGVVSTERAVEQSHTPSPAGEETKVPTQTEEEPIAFATTQIPIRETQPKKDDEGYIYPKPGAPGLEISPQPETTTVEQLEVTTGVPAEVSKQNIPAADQVTEQPSPSAEEEKAEETTSPSPSVEDREKEQPTEVQTTPIAEAEQTPRETEAPIRTTFPAFEEPTTLPSATQGAVEEASATTALPTIQPSELTEEGAATTPQELPAYTTFKPITTKVYTTVSVEEETTAPVTQQPEVAPEAQTVKEEELTVAPEAKIPEKTTEEAPGAATTTQPARESATTPVSEQVPEVTTAAVKEGVTEIHEEEATEGATSESAPEEQPQTTQKVSLETEPTVEQTTLGVEVSKEAATDYHAAAATASGEHVTVEPEEAVSETYVPSHDQLPGETPEEEEEEGSGEHTQEPISATEESKGPEATETPEVIITPAVTEKSGERVTTVSEEELEPTSAVTVSQPSEEAEFVSPEEEHVTKGQASTIQEHVTELSTSEYTKPELATAPAKTEEGTYTTQQPTETETETQEVQETKVPSELTSVATESITSPSVTEASTATEAGEERVTESEVPEHVIPGEGSCLVDGRTYANNTSIPPINQCQVSCRCMSSIVHCESIPCSPPPANLENCTPVFEGTGHCCPTFSCTPPSSTEIESDSHKMQEASTTPEQLTTVAGTEQPSESTKYVPEVPKETTRYASAEEEVTEGATEAATTARVTEESRSTEKATVPESTESVSEETEATRVEGGVPSTEPTPVTEAVEENEILGEEAKKPAVSPEATTVVPEKAPEAESAATTLATEQAVTTSAPEQPAPTSVPEESSSTSVPELAATTSAAEEEAEVQELSTAKPKPSEEVTPALEEKVGTSVQPSSAETEKYSVGTEAPVEAETEAATEAEIEIAQTTAKYAEVTKEVSEAETVAATSPPAEEAGVTEAAVEAATEIQPKKPESTVLPESEGVTSVQEVTGTTEGTVAGEVTEKGEEATTAGTIEPVTEVVPAKEMGKPESHVTESARRPTSEEATTQAAVTETIASSSQVPQEEHIPVVISEVPEEEVAPTRLPAAAAPTTVAHEELTKATLPPETTQPEQEITAVPEQVAHDHVSGEEEEEEGESEKPTEAEKVATTEPTKEAPVTVVVPEEVPKETAATEVPEEVTTQAGLAPTEASKEPSSTAPPEEVTSAEVAPTERVEEALPSESPQEVTSPEIATTEIAKEAAPTEPTKEYTSPEVATTEAAKEAPSTEQPKEEEPSQEYTSTEAEKEALPTHPSWGVTPAHEATTEPATEIAATEPVKETTEAVEVQTEPTKEETATEAAVERTTVPAAEEVTTSKPEVELEEHTGLPAATTTSAVPEQTEREETAAPEVEASTSAPLTTQTPREEIKPEVSETTTVGAEHEATTVPSGEEITTALPVEEQPSETKRPTAEEVPEVTERVGEAEAATEIPVTTQPPAVPETATAVSEEEGEVSPLTTILPGISEEQTVKEEPQEVTTEPILAEAETHAPEEAEVPAATTALYHEEVTSTSEAEEAATEAYFTTGAPAYEQSKLPEGDLASHATALPTGEVETVRPELTTEAATERETSKAEAQTEPVIAETESVPVAETTVPSVSEAAETETPTSLEGETRRPSEISSTLAEEEKQPELTTVATEPTSAPKVEVTSRPEEGVTSPQEQEIVTTEAGVPSAGETEISKAEVTTALPELETSKAVQTTAEADVTKQPSVEEETTRAEIEAHVTEASQETTGPVLVTEAEEAAKPQITTTVSPVAETVAAVTERKPEEQPEVPATTVGSQTEAEAGVPTTISPDAEKEEATEVQGPASSEATTVKPEIGRTTVATFEEETTQPAAATQAEELAPATTSRPAIPGEGVTVEEPAAEKEKAPELESASVTTAVYETSNPYTEEKINVSVTERLPAASTLVPSVETSRPSFFTSPVSTEAPTSVASNEVPEVPDYTASTEEDYPEEEDQGTFGPGTCRYGGKLYMSAQQIPRDDPCDFCFCFRSDIICLQQSCPPPIPHCHEEPIRGFCCPRYECPVSMATTLNLTTTSTTTTTTLPPHFLAHAYSGRATKQGCQIQGQAYKVGDVIKSASGPCLHCTCGGDGQMKCDPKACSPEPMLRQMIAAAESRRRR